MKINKLKRTLKEGKIGFGSWLTLGHVGIAEIMAQEKSDFLTIDLEHSATTIDQAQELIRVIELLGLTPLVRVSSNNENEIKKVMDAGAYGIIVPMIESEEDAKKVISSVYYAPIGKRGVGLFRAQGYGSDFFGYQSWLKEEGFVVVQIESKNGIDHLDEILSVKGVDAAMIGPYDLSSSLGVPGQLSHPWVLEAEETFLKVCLSHQIAAGIHIVHPDSEEVTRKMNAGYRLIAYGADMIFLSHAVKQHLRTHH